MQSRTLVLGLFLALMAAPAYAHTGAHTGFSFAAGFAHPFGGLDHLLAMFAVGLLAAQLGRRAMWLVPSAFVGTMIVGAFVGLSGTALPAVEIAILASGIAIALPVAFTFGISPAIAAVLVGFFALSHGFAHGAELPAQGEALPYIAGFALATALVHAAGISFGLAAGRLSTERNALALRAAGALVILAGIGVAVG